MTPSTSRLPSEAQGHRSASVRPIADLLIYAAIVFCSLMNALFGAYRTDSDTAAYLDLSDAIKTGNWHFAINSYWFPFYPFLLTLGRALFGFGMQYEIMAARLVDALLNLVFVLAAVALAASVRRLMLARGTPAEYLIPARTLYLWSAVVAYFLASIDLTNMKPDTLTSIFMILTVTALLHALAHDTILAWFAVGVCGGLAYWAKAFAFPFFFLWIFLAAAANLRKGRVLARLVLALVVFLIVAAPLIWRISSLQGRLTYGESSGLNQAWLVNHADRFNPVADLTVYQSGTALAHFTHPGELLSKSPFIAYYGGPHSYGSTPQWTEPAYWSDGLKPRFVWRQTLASIRSDLAVLASLFVMRLQVALLAVMLAFWGFRMRRRSFADPALFAALILAVACVGLFIAVYLEGRHVAFALLIFAVVYAGCSLRGRRVGSDRSLHTAVLFAAALVLLFDFQGTLRDARVARAQGAQHLHGIYSMPIVSAGTELGRLYPRDAEVACMGDAACWGDPYWVRYGGLRLTAIIETGGGLAVKSAEQSCGQLARHPEALDALRKKNVRAIVARFDGTQACSADWRPLGTSPNFSYLPLDYLPLANLPLN
jgi:hypothetical protein